MSDADFLAKVREADTPEKVLRLIVENEEFLGSDPYYADLGRAMLDQAEKVLQREEPVCEGDPTKCLCDEHCLARQAAKYEGLTRRERRALQRKEYLANWVKP